MAKKLSFKLTKLMRSSGDCMSHSSVPLVLPDDMSYDESTNTVIKKEACKRTSLKVTECGIELLRSIKKPVAVLSIGGPYRTGKSYILSRILGSHDAFELGHTMSAKTFGIWMGTQVLECDDYVIILLDTEGIDAVSGTAEGDAGILVLTLLLSSYFIYNSLNVPMKKDLEKMSMFVQLATSIVVRNGEENDVNELREYFPSFLWLLRDVHLIPTNDKGEAISPTEYLKTQVLVRSKGFFESPSDMVARAILAFFPYIECRTLPRPSGDAEVMQDIANSVSKISPSFNQEVDELIESLKIKTPVKRGFTGGLINGPLLASLVQKYAESLNQPDAIPALDDSWKAVISLQKIEVVAELVSEYESEMSRAIGDSLFEEDNITGEEGSVTLMGLHRQLLSDKISKLVKRITFFMEKGEDERLVKELERQVVEYELRAVNQGGRSLQRKVVVGGVLYRFVVQNHKRSTEFCQSLIDQLYEPIHIQLTSGNSEYTYQDLLNDLAKVYTGYMENAKGPAKWEVYDEKKKTTDNDKVKFSQLKGYEAEIQKSVEEAEKKTLENVSLAEKVNTLHSQMVHDEEVHRKAIEDMKRAQEETLEKMREDEEERKVREERKYEDFVQAQMKDMADMARQNQENVEKQQHMMMEMIKQQQEMHTKALQTMADQMKMVPPPAPVQRRSLFNISLPDIVKLPIEKCSIM